MNTILIITGSAGTVLAAGAYLRWACAPVILAFQAGTALGRRQGARAAAEEWREDRALLVRTIARIAEEPAE